jgi:hypothetical protein
MAMAGGGGSGPAKIPAIGLASGEGQGEGEHEGTLSYTPVVLEGLEVTGGALSTGGRAGGRR